jgi:phosphate-selective porin OprO/OprP
MIRKHFAGFAASALALAVSAQAFAGTVTTDGADIVVKTKGGLEVATTDKEFGFKIGGRLQADYNQFDGVFTDDGKTANEAFFRRAILEISGTAYKDWKYVFNYDFSNGNTSSGNSSDWDEASISYTGFAPVTIKVGRFDPDFGLEKATSSKWITAMERSGIYEIASWVNDKQDGMGVQVSGVAGNMFYGSAGYFNKDGAEYENEHGKDQSTYNLRAVIAPMAEAGNVLHFGINYANRDVEDFNGSVTSRMGVRGTTEDTTNGNRPTFAPGVTGQFDGDSAWGLEAAYAVGPFSVQSEYLKRDIDAKSNSTRNDREATGYNVQLAYTLTGEARGYKLDGGKFDSIKPNDKQMGAWEVFYRYDNIKVEESGFDDTKGKAHTVGVNWYANEAVKVSANYIKGKTDNVTNDVGDDDGDSLALRLQYVF